MLKFFVKESPQPAQACVIWLHGLGSSGENMSAVATAIPHASLALEHVFVDAPVRPVTMNNHMPMRAWYDLTGINLHNRDDRLGILDSEKEINHIITQQIDKGFHSQQIYLAGFSQGGAMALFIGLRTQRLLGGVLSLSAYLPQQVDCTTNHHLNLPIFMAMGRHDPIVLPAWTKLSYDFVISRGFQNVVWKEYPMEHMICMDEIRDMTNWLDEHITLAAEQRESL